MGTSSGGSKRGMWPNECCAEPSSVAVSMAVSTLGTSPPWVWLKVCRGVDAKGWGQGAERRNGDWYTATSRRLQLQTRTTHHGDMPTPPPLGHAPQLCSFMKRRIYSTKNTRR